MLRDAILPRLRDYFANRGRDLVAVYLFGSVARGDDKPSSDVDIGIVFGLHGRPGLTELDRLAGFQADLADLLGRDVDLVSFDGAPPDLVHRAFLDKVVVFEGEHDARIEFEIRARNEYFDLQPLLERYRRSVLERT